MPSRLLVLDNNKVDDVYADYFQTFALDGAFGNLLSFTPTGQGALAGTGSNYYEIDNVMVSTPVPEPATLSLFALGSAYLFARRRRNIAS